MRNKLMSVWNELKSPFGIALILFPLLLLVAASATYFVARNLAKSMETAQVLEAKLEEARRQLMTFDEPEWGDTIHQLCDESGSESYPGGYFSSDEHRVDQTARFVGSDLVLLGLFGEQEGLGRMLLTIELWGDVPTLNLAEGEWEMIATAVICRLDEMKHEDPTILDGLTCERAVEIVEEEVVPLVEEAIAVGV